MVLEEPREVEKFVRMLPVAMRSASKDMVYLEGGVFWRGNGSRCGAEPVVQRRIILTVGNPNA